MTLSQRQEKILNSLVREYIHLAEPVSSQVLQKKHKFGLSTATIRNEMQKLTEAGYLHQPHTSAGRVPTDKGYRFFVDGLFEKGLKEDLAWDLEKEIKDSLKMSREITKFLACHSSNLALGYLPEDKILWKEGWPELLEEPEFIESEFTSHFTRMLNDFEQNIDSYFKDLSAGVQVYIGRENPFSKEREFSLVIARCNFPKQPGLLTVLGPKRMAYDKNIHLINSVINILAKR